MLYNDNQVGWKALIFGIDGSLGGLNKLPTPLSKTPNL